MMFTDASGTQVRLLDADSRGLFPGVYYGPNPSHTRRAGDRVLVAEGPSRGLRGRVVHTDEGVLFAGLFVKIDGQVIPGQWVLVEHLRHA